jgi:hypothetical protein
MICFEVRLNGKLLCTAGIGDLGVLTAHLTWVRRDENACPDGLDCAEWSKEVLNLYVGGSQGYAKEGHEFLRWITDQGISVDDEITIKVLEQSECDSPSERQAESSEFVSEQKRIYYEKLKAEYAGEKGDSSEPQKGGSQ